jgi:hypothetical protein
MASQKTFFKFSFNVHRKINLNLFLTILRMLAIILSKGSFCERLPLLLFFPQEGFVLDFSC